MLGPWEQMTPELSFFADFCDGRTGERDGLMFWDQSQF
jgi:hypothetical protein